MEETMNLTIIFLRPTARVVGSGMAECRPGMVPFWSRLSTRSLVIPPLFKCETSRGLFIAVWFHTMFWLLFWDDHIFTLTPMFHMVRPPCSFQIERFFHGTDFKLPRLFVGKAFCKRTRFLHANAHHTCRSLESSTWQAKVPPRHKPDGLSRWRSKKKNNVESIQLKRKLRYIQPMSPTFDVNCWIVFAFGSCRCDNFCCHAMTPNKKLSFYVTHICWEKICSRVGSALCHRGISQHLPRGNPPLSAFTFTTSLLRWLIWVWQEHTSGIWVCIGWESSETHYFLWLWGWRLDLDHQKQWWLHGLYFRSSNLVEIYAVRSLGLELRKNLGWTTMG